jgi:hypothetical protein
MSFAAFGAKSKAEESSHLFANSVFACCFSHTVAFEMMPHKHQIFGKGNPSAAGDSATRVPYEPEWSGKARDSSAPRSA